MKFNVRKCYSGRKLISLCLILSSALETWCDTESRQVHTIHLACDSSACILIVYAAIARPICNESHLNLTFSPLPILCLFVYKQTYVWRKEGTNEYGSLRKTWGPPMCVSEWDIPQSGLHHVVYEWRLLGILVVFCVGGRSVLWCCWGLTSDK
jgi:hypothetical protein